MDYSSSLRHINSNNNQNSVALPQIKRTAKSINSSYQTQSHSLKLIDRSNKLILNKRLVHKDQTISHLKESKPTQKKRRSQKTKTQVVNKDDQKFSSLENQQWGKTLEEFHKNIEENRKIVSNQMSSIFKKKLMQRESLKKIKFRNMEQSKVSQKRLKNLNFAGNINQIFNRKSISYIKNMQHKGNISLEQDKIYDKFQSLKNSNKNIEIRDKQSTQLLSALMSSCNLLRETKTLENQNERLQFLRKKTDASLQKLLQYRKAILILKRNHDNSILNK